MHPSWIQAAVFVALTALVAVLTWRKCRSMGPVANASKAYFLAGGQLSWPFVAGSLLLTNISAEQIVGMNGAQALLVAWWELGAALALVLIAKVLIPRYFRYGCTTTTEFLEHRLGDAGIRSIVSALFLLGYLAILLPMVLYTGALFMKSMFALELSILTISAVFALAGLLYAAFGGLRAIAVSDTFNGVGLLIMGLAVTLCALAAVHWDLSGIPAERLSLFGGPASDIPWPTLFTGMLLAHFFYWGTNMVIAQRALAAKSLAEAQKGLYAAAGFKLLTPLIVVLPGLIAYKLYGPVGDLAYGRLVADVLPPWASGAFAAVIFGAVLSSYNSCLNSAAALYTCDFHQKYVNPRADVKAVGQRVALLFTLGSLALVPLYEQARSIIDTLQRLNGLYSMPVLAAFIAAVLFKRIAARAVKAGLLLGVILYAVFTFLWSPLHYLHLMAITLASSLAFMLLMDRVFQAETPLAVPVAE
ncbi:MAG: solute:sodium symporter family transporter [Gammaproteobacteria bacterium]|nr:solute:sodium symporter family transporter [Gammaproteobacteria bacterium]